MKFSAGLFFLLGAASAFSPSVTTTHKTSALRMAEDGDDRRAFLGQVRHNNT